MKVRHRKAVPVNLRGVGLTSADPSRTKSIRTALGNEMRRRVDSALDVILVHLTDDSRWEGKTHSEVAEQVRQLIADTLFTHSLQRNWWYLYLEQAYSLGVSRSYDDVTRWRKYAAGQDQTLSIPQDKTAFIRAVMLRGRVVSDGTHNAFCPTGKGGGIDPSCGGDESNPQWTVWKNPSTDFYRGMSKTAYEEFVKTGRVPKSHDANVMSTERETAEYYASPKIHEEDGILVKFKVHPDDLSSVQQDRYVPEDFRITKPVRHLSHSVVAIFHYQPATHNTFCPTGEGGGVDPSCSGKKTSSRDPLSSHEVAAQASADHTSSVFGIPESEVQFHRLLGERTYGGHGPSQAHLVNVHEGNKINKVLNVPLDRVVTEGEHLAAHEIAHRAYSVSSEAGKAAQEALARVKAQYGSAVSLYGAFNGSHENLMELGAVYSHSPEALKRYSPEMYTIAKRWADSVKEATTNSSPRDVRGQFISQRVKDLATRLENEVQGLNADIAQRLARKLQDGLDKGYKPSTIANSIVREIKDFGKERAKVIAETEVVRAQAEGQLDAMEQLGEEKVGVAVEWTTTGKRGRLSKKGNLSPCPLCAPMRGVVLSVQEARGMIPRHPRCLCAFSVAGAVQQGRRKVSRSSVEKAIDRSKTDEDDTWGPGQEITEERPTVNVVFGEELYGFSTAMAALVNEFCPTGQGGGINPHCTPSGGKVAKKSKARVEPMIDLVGELPAFAGMTDAHIEALAHARRGLGWVHDVPAGDTFYLETVIKARRVKSETLVKLLGTAHPSVIASAVGAPDDAVVKYRVDPYSKQVVVSITHSRFVAARTFLFDNKSNKVVHNDYFRVTGEKKGFGTQVFKDQVENLKELGYARIETWAAKGAGYNGYYTWARLGYDQPISAFRDPRTRARILQQFPSAKTVSDIIHTEFGREWWKQNGANMRKAVFDLKDGSKSLRDLYSYIEAKDDERKKMGEGIHNVEDSPYLPDSSNEDDLPPSSDEADEIGDIDTFDVLAALNAFCPTGTGGRINPHCGKDARTGHLEGSKWIAREDMPQVKSSQQEKLIRWLQKNGVRVTHEHAYLDELKPLQHEYDPSKVVGKPVTALSKPIVVSKGGRILDGTHHWLRAKELGMSRVPVIRLGVSWWKAFRLMHEFPKSFTAALTSNADTQVVASITRVFVYPVTTNSFCPTGEGGGINPHCGKKDLKVASVELPKSRAKVLVPSVTLEKEADTHLQRIFGGTPEQARKALAESLGMPDTVTLQILHAGKYVTRYDDDIPLDAHGVSVKVFHPKGDIEAKYFVGIDDTGKRFIRTEFIVLADKLVGKGMGTDLFVRHVEGAGSHGIDYLSLHAAGPEGQLNGYYTWPRFGFDMRFDDFAHTKYVEPATWHKYQEAQRKFPGARSVLDIFSTKEGRQWWKNNGAEMLNAKFALEDRPDNRSLQVIRAYQAARENQSTPKSSSLATRNETWNGHGQNWIKFGEMRAVKVDNRFCATGPEGGIDPSCKATQISTSWGERKSHLDSLSKHKLAWVASKNAKGSVQPSSYMTLTRSKLLGVIELQERHRYAPKTMTKDEWKTTSDEQLALRHDSTANGFCPTGEGGGINPHCGKDAATPTHPAYVKILHGLRSSPNLSTQQFQEYLSSVKSILSRMPRGALDRLDTGVSSVHFHPDHLSAGLGGVDSAIRAPGIPKEIVERLQALRYLIESGHTKAGGVYIPSTREIHMDSGLQPGETGKTTSPALPHNPSSHVHAHELTHAIDGPSYELSRSELWGRVHRDEMGMGKLTHYASTDPRESFAEFGRLLYASHHKPAEVEKMFPAASRFFKFHGLWPAETK